MVISEKNGVKTIYLEKGENLRVGITGQDKSCTMLSNTGEKLLIRYGHSILHTNSIDINEPIISEQLFRYLTDLVQREEDLTNRRKFPISYRTYDLKTWLFLSLRYQLRLLVGHNINEIIDEINKLKENNDDLYEQHITALVRAYNNLVESGFSYDDIEDNGKYMPVDHDLIKRYVNIMKTR